jgi:hypothetical protein
MCIGRHAFWNINMDNPYDGPYIHPEKRRWESPAIGQEWLSPWLGVASQGT